MTAAIVILTAVTVLAQLVALILYPLARCLFRPDCAHNTNSDRTHL